ncbi:MAG: NAD-dependent epimerase/dehydratase family protein [Candidatus Binatia bacterium]
MRALVTGATGFVGRHLVARLMQEKWTVVAGSTRGESLGSGVQSVRFEMCDRAALRRFVNDGIDVVFHFAFSRRSRAEMARVALEGTATLLEEAAGATRPPRILLASSGAVYGWSSGSRPVTEDDPLVPATYYAVVKRAQEDLAASYTRQGALHVVTVRLFNALGPGEDGTLVTGAVALQIARGERAGRRFEVCVGNVDSYRDFIDVRDAACAFTAAADAGAPGEVFNVCSEESVQTRTVAEFLCASARAPADLVSRCEGARGPDVPYQVGSAVRLRARTGWTRQVTVQQSLFDLLRDLREKVAAYAT